MKCIALLHIIITDIEGLHDFSSNDRDSIIANGGIQFKKSRIHNSFTASSKRTRDLFCGFSHISAGFVQWQLEATGNVR